MDTQANESHGLTPLPLHEQVPGAWNFREPNPHVDRSFVDVFTPGPAGQQILHTVARADLDTVPRPIKLDPAARRILVEALWMTIGDFDALDGHDDPEDKDWALIEQALGDIVSHLYPARYVTGIDHAAGDPGRP